MPVYTATIHLWSGGEYSRTFLFYEQAYAWARREAGKQDLVSIGTSFNPSDNPSFRKFRGNLVSAQQAA